MKRNDGRRPDELRPVNLSPGFMPNAEGSCLIEMGGTKVICTATVETSVPRWMQGRGTGWVTAEYSMLPRSSSERISREVNKGRVGGRTQEIQRLIGRSLRAITDMKALGERSVIIDCDVLQADGGTRTASITGGYVALALAIRWLEDNDGLGPGALTSNVAAISIRILDRTPILDLDYSEDSTAEVDMNVVMTGSGQLVEVQGTAERGVFERSELDAMIDLASDGVARLTALQKEAVEGAA